MDNFTINHVAINYLMRNFGRKLDNMVIVAPRSESVARAKLFKD